ncbi:hypothetical protein BHE90_002762 [Fusarium euwallaceae]|uniref:Uncharacterized protein n=1 Tax=Fusarium euwallaceae TaxID=1147111 RepID=A0A430M4A5_9HYPO|nr:hypothetical protein BHE90_002762 [Fusarium euwallaceae]
MNNAELASLDASTYAGSQDDPPPPYSGGITSGSSTAVSSLAPSASRADTGSQMSSSQTLVSECVRMPYRPLPRMLKVSWQWNKWRIFFIGDEATPKMFAVSEYSGLLGRGPGAGPCLMIHNGTTGKDPILAATGDALRDPCDQSGSLESVVNVSAPPWMEDEAKVVTEIMYTGLAENEDVVHFRWEIETKRETVQGTSYLREEFEWRMVSAEVITDPKYPHQFRLYRVGESLPGQEGYLATASWKEAAWKTCRIEFEGGYENLGERWGTMVVMTALRIWQLGRTGQASLEYVADCFHFTKE